MRVSMRKVVIGLAAITLCHSAIAAEAVTLHSGNKTLQAVRQNGGTLAAEGTTFVPQEVLTNCAPTAPMNPQATSTTISCQVPGIGVINFTANWSKSVCTTPTINLATDSGAVSCQGTVVFSFTGVAQDLQGKIYLRSNPK